MKWHERLKEELRQRNWSIPDLAEKMGRPGDANLKEKLYKYVTGAVENPRGTTLSDIATALGISEPELKVGFLPAHPVINLAPAAAPAHNAIIGGPVVGFSKIPLRGQGMGGKDGSLVFSGDQNLGDVLAPPALSAVPGAYAVYVVGESMLERFAPGEVVYVNPHPPVRKGDDCVIQIQMPDGERHGWIKRFISRDGTSVKVQQLNPRKIMKFDARTVISVHKIIMAGPA